MSLFYTPWKHQKTFRFSGVFRGYRKATRAVMGEPNTEDFRSRKFRQLHTEVFTKSNKFDLIETVSRCLKQNCFFYWLQMTWISELAGHREWSFLKTLTDFIQLRTNLDPILDYFNIYIECKKRLIQSCGNYLNWSCHRLETFLLTVNKHSRPFVNEHYVYMALFYTTVTPLLRKHLFRKKKAASRLYHWRAVSLLQNLTPLLLKYNCC